MSRFIITHGSRGLAKGSTPTVNPLVGKTVFFKYSQEGNTQTLAGLVKSVNGDTAQVALAVPSNDGLLYASKSLVPVKVHDLTEVDASLVDTEVKSWTDSNSFSDTKAREVKNDDDETEDYKDVTFSGLASTFVGTTPEDRDGDYIMPSAYNEDLKEYRNNPVMLTDHTRKVNNCMGSFTKVAVDSRGLLVEGKLTNSMANDAVHARALVAEGHLKTLSVGGLFFYAEDYRGIEKICLYEISLVVVPANPDATFSVRSLDRDVAAKALSKHLKNNGGELRIKS